MTLTGGTQEPVIQSGDRTEELSTEQADILTFLMERLAKRDRFNPDDLNAIREIFTQELLDPEGTKEGRLLREAGLGGGKRRAARQLFAKAQEQVTHPGDTGGPGTTNIGGTVVPVGAQLIRLRSPAGSEDPTIFFLEYKAFGVTVRYEIGNRDAAIAAFGGDFLDQFDGVTTLSQQQFDEEGTTLGLLDEIAGSTESIQSRFERGIRELGLGDLPQWMREDTEIMTILMLGTEEELDAGTIANQLSQTGGFAAEYPGWEALQGFMGGATILDTIDEYSRRRTELTSLIRRYRGPDTDVSNQYLGTLIGTGWEAREAAQILEGERQLSSGEALANLNDILTFNQMETVDEGGFLELMRGNAAPEVFEAINDALRRKALSEEGIDVDVDFAVSLGAGSSTAVADLASFGGSARQAALDILNNGRELEAGKFGITREEIVAASFGEPLSSETDAKLAQFGRERRAAAGGFAFGGGFIDAEGRLRMQGTAAL